MIDWLRREPDEAKQALAYPITSVKIDSDFLEELDRAEEEEKSEDS